MEKKVSIPKELAYLDTNIFSFYFAEHPRYEYFRDVTRQWWEQRRKDFYFCTSSVARNELREGGYEHQNKALELLKLTSILPLNEQILDLAQYYIDHFLAPKSDIKLYRGDAWHLAICSYYKVDYLITWNQKHLANVNKMRQLKLMNAKLDLTTPVIVTPAQLLY